MFSRVFFQSIPWGWCIRIKRLLLLLLKVLLPIPWLLHKLCIESGLLPFELTLWCTISTSWPDDVVSWPGLIVALMPNKNSIVLFFLVALDLSYREDHAYAAYAAEDETTDKKLTCWSLVTSGTHFVIEPFVLLATTVATVATAIAATGVASAAISVLYLVGVAVRRHFYIEKFWKILL